MKSWIINFQEIGICTVNVNKLCKIWSTYFQIYSYDCGDRIEWKLLFSKKPKSMGKILISEEQASEIIEKMNLIKQPDSFFLAITHYKNKKLIELQLEEIKQLFFKKEQELMKLKMQVDLLANDIICLSKTLN